eukprot:15354552-Ditylum_brightwellii.AAC.3
MGAAGTGATNQGAQQEPVVGYFKVVLDMLQHHHVTIKLKKCKWLHDNYEFVGIGIGKSVQHLTPAANPKHAGWAGAGQTGFNEVVLPQNGLVERQHGSSVAVGQRLRGNKRGRRRKKSRGEVSICQGIERTKTLLYCSHMPMHSNGTGEFDPFLYGRSGSN